MNWATPDLNELPEFESVISTGSILNLIQEELVAGVPTRGFWDIGAS